jgi:cAMP phosphodiesterase
MTTAKNARVCIISFSAFRPTLVASSPDFYKRKTVVRTKLLHEKGNGSKLKTSFYLPNPRKNFIVQYRDVEHYSDSLTHKIEIAAKSIPVSTDNPKRYRK